MAKKDNSKLTLDEKKERFNTTLKEARQAYNEFRYADAKKLYDRLMKELKHIKVIGTKRIVTYEYYSVLSASMNLDTASTGFNKLLFELLMSEDSLDKENIKLRVKILFELARIHLLKNEYKEAIIKLNMIEEQANQALKSYKDKENIDTLTSYINYANVKRGYLYAKFGDLKKSYEYLSKATSFSEEGLISNTEMLLSMYYLKKKLGIPIEKNYAFERNHEYFIQQVNKYSKKSAKKHISLHVQSDNIYVPKNQLFFKGTNVDELFEKVKNNLNDKTYYKNTIVDKYIIDFKRPIGITEGVETNLVMVVTLLNEPDKILTMYPAMHEKSKARVRK